MIKQILLAWTNCCFIRA